MGLHWVDWTILSVYMLVMFLVGVVYKERAKSGLSSFFLSSRSIPWWLAGTSIVATTFSADTPLAITGFVAKDGVAGNWFWWVTCLSTMTVTFFFAKWWRRAEILTDVEYIELRYSGKSAAVLRGFSAIYKGLILNTVKLGFVFLAMAKILDAVFGVGKEEALLVSVAVTTFYCVMSGFWGVVITDFIQFFVAMGGSIALAIFAVGKVGGLAGLKAGLVAQYGAKGASDMLAILPPIDSTWMPFFTLIVYFGIMWWSDAHVEGGGYIAQRLMSSKDERHATFANLWFNFAHIALRPWPWIIVALVSVVMFPNLADKEQGFPMMINTVLPIGFKGLMITAFFAAFMSTVDTLLNWGSSYLVNDFYKRFVAKEKTDKHYVVVAKVCGVGITVASLLLSYAMNSIGDMWKLLAAFTSGMGVIYIARWFWWRVNAWSEISAMIASGVTTIILTVFTDLDFAHSICVILPVSMASWLTATFITSPTDMERLTEFYKRVRPYPFFWKPVLARIADPALKRCPDNFAKSLRCWVWGVTSVYSLLFAIGKWVFMDIDQAIILSIATVVAASILWWEMRPGDKAAAERATMGAPVVRETVSEIAG